MATARFYSPMLSPGTVRLSENESRHSAGARRLSVGDAIVLFDGSGHEATGHIATVSRKGVEVTIGDIALRPRQTPALTLAIALPKGPRQDFLIEKCTELGVRALQPIVTERSIAEATPHRLQKWQRTAIEAAKQSGQCWLPEFHEPKSLAELVKDFNRFDRVLLMKPGGDRLELSSPINSLLAIVGPEGGWTDDEVALLVSSGAKAVSLGPNILRIETAAIALAAMVHVSN